MTAPHPRMSVMSLSAVPPAPDPAAIAAGAAWSPESWRGKTALQMPTYPDPVALDAALHELKRLPPLVTSWEILALKQQLADAQEGKRFLLQGGDCGRISATANRARSPTG